MRCVSSDSNIILCHKNLVVLQLLCSKCNEIPRSFLRKSFIILLILFFFQGLSLVNSTYSGDDYLVSFGGYNGKYSNEVILLLNYVPYKTEDNPRVLSFFNFLCNAYKTNVSIAKCGTKE